MLFRMRRFVEKIWNDFNKKTYWFSVSELENRVKYAKVVFFIYVFVAVLTAVIGAVICSNMVSVIVSFESVSTGTMFLLLLSSFSMINFFLLMFLWLSNEAGYYRVIQLLYELFLYHEEEE